MEEVVVEGALAAVSEVEASKTAIQDEGAKPEETAAEGGDEGVKPQKSVTIVVPEEGAELASQEAVEGEIAEEIEEEADVEPKEITPEEHEENIAVMGDVLVTVIDMAAEGKLPEKEEKPEFQMKEKVDSTEELLEPRMEEQEEEVTEEQVVSPEGSVEEQEEEEEEEAESASVQEAWARRQQLLDEFDSAHDEAQRLRIMNLLLQSRVLRSMQRRAKTKGAGHASTVSTGSKVSQAGAPVGDMIGMADALEKELLEAGEVRKQLDAELQRGTVEEALRQRLSTAKRHVLEKEVQLQQLQDKAMARLRAPPARRQEAERMLKRVWPQLLRLRKERLMHTRARHELDSARRQVAELEAFGPQRTVGAYEQLSADGVKLAERVQERTEQLAALRNVAERDLQQAAHLREALQGAHIAVAESRRNDLRATIFLQRARQEVLKTKKNRDDLYKENGKLTRQMELLAFPELLRDHEEVRRRLRLAQADLEKLRTSYANQERRIAAARKLLMQRELSLREGEPESSHHSFLKLTMDAKVGPSLLDTRLEALRN